MRASLGNTGREITVVDDDDRAARIQRNEIICIKRVFSEWATVSWEGVNSLE
jgi:hypothetical protein